MSSGRPASWRELAGRLARRLAFAACAFVAITVVTFAIVASERPRADVAEPGADPGADLRLARLSDRYALDRPAFYNPAPPDPAQTPHAKDVASAVPSALRGDAVVLGATLDRLRASGAPVPGFGDPRSDPRAFRRDVGLWWRRHASSFVDRGAFWRATIGRVAETRYGAWISDLVHLDFGDSIAIRPEAPVADLLRERAPATLLVMGAAIAVLFLVSVPLGLLCAARRGGAFDRAASGVLFVLHATPEFWVGTLALVYLCSDAHLGILPAAGILGEASLAALRDGRAGPLDGAILRDLAWHLVLPVAILVLPAIVVVARHVRAAAIEVLGARFIIAARARGIPERRILFVHVLRACAPTVVTLFTSVLPILVTGSILVEVLFGVTGMGHLTWQAATLRDHPVAMAILATTATVMLVAHVAGDVVHAALDPRLRS